MDIGEGTNASLGGVTCGTLALCGTASCSWVTSLYSMFTVQNSTRLKSSTRENHAAERLSKYKMYEAAARVTQQSIL